MHSLACLIHKMGIFFTSYAQQIQRQIGSKPQTEIPIQPLRPFQKWHPPKQPFMFVVQFHILKRSAIDSNLILAVRMAHGTHSAHFSTLTNIPPSTPFPI